MILTIKNLCKSYEREILKNINYTFESGKLYVIKGVSGCGKTSLLNVLGGLDTAFEGERRCRAKRISYVFQKSLLLSGLTVQDNLVLIRNDKERIEEVTATLGISSLLNHLPSQLSGGERQRVSVARALLNDPQILLADEPTASLDGENSRQIANLFASLKSSKRILIIATHENWFDDFADQVLQLRYGELRTNQEERLSTNECGSEGETSREEKSRKRLKRKPLLRLALKRHPERLRIRSLLPIAIAFLLLFTAGAIESNYSREARRFAVSKYPMDTIVLGRDKLKEFPYLNELKIYDYLTIREKELTAYYLMPEKDSVFHVKDMLKVGSFPKKQNEVIITEAAARLLFPSLDYASCVGKTFRFLEKNWVVAAVSNDQSKTFADNFGTDVYYQNMEEAAVFIDYETLSTIAEPSLPSWDEYSVMCVLDGLGLDPEKQKVVEEAKTIRIEYPNGDVEEIKDLINPYYQLIEFEQREIDTILQRFYLIFALLSVLLCLYMMSVIRTELFYRRKELGYLQIFGLSRRETQRMLIGEYAVKVFAGLLFGWALFCLVIVLYRIIVGAWVWTNEMAMLLCGVFAGAYLLFVYFVTHRFLRRSVLSLIT